MQKLFWPIFALIIVSGIGFYAYFWPQGGLNLNDKADSGTVKEELGSNLPQNSVLEGQTHDVIFVEEKVAGFNQLISPRDLKGVGELLDLLKGFGELINVPRDQLTEEFAKRDKEIIAKTKEVYRNPEQFALGQQCGGEGAADTFPPGGTTRAACGGDPEFSITGGGGSCNTDRPCFGTGFCFFEFYCYRGGCYGYCWVPSCLGKCGFQSYLWDSVTKTCGCGAIGSEKVPEISDDSTNIPEDAPNLGEAISISEALGEELILEEKLPQSGTVDKPGDSIRK